MNILAAFSSYSSNDIEACKAFYKDVLGIVPEGMMGGIRLTVGGQQVFIYPKDDHQPATFTVLNFAVSDIDEAVDDLMAKGVEFVRYDNAPGEQDERGVMRGKDAGMGPNIAWFEDPSGNILALMEE